MANEKEKDQKVKARAPRIPYRIIKQHQNLWSWRLFYSNLTVGSETSRQQAEVLTRQMIEMETKYPTLYKLSNFVSHHRTR